MTNASIEKWIWILIYAGMLVLAAALAVQSRAPQLAWPVGIGGAVAVVAGIALIYIRSRRKDAD
jgi:hypothetical protein